MFNNEKHKQYKTSVTAAYFFIAPALIAILIFFFIPVIAAFIISFTDFDIYALGNINTVRFVGLKNYIRLFEDPLFWLSLKNTSYYVLLATPLSIAVSLGAALLLNSKLLKYKGIFRLSYFIPYITTLVAVAIIWRFIYHPKFGILNYFLGLIGINPIDWLGDPNWAMPATPHPGVRRGYDQTTSNHIMGLVDVFRDIGF